MSKPPLDDVQWNSFLSSFNGKRMSKRLRFANGIGYACDPHHTLDMLPCLRASPRP